MDILINNAGISYVGLLSEMSIDEWNRIVGVNLTSVFSTCKHAIPHMLHRQSGKIINISSIWEMSALPAKVPPILRAKEA